MKTVKIILGGIGAIIGGFMLYLLAVALTPRFPTPKQDLSLRELKPDDDVASTAPRSEVTFDVDGTTLRAWLYLPADRTTPAPCIVMAHGLGGTKAMGLDRYAARFQAAGFAALAFDYRCWGDSDGEPRGLIWIPHQLADYTAAIEYARNREGIDPHRIALWGSSFSGGHVVVTASEDHDIACVIAQCPGLDGHESVRSASQREGIDLRIIAHAQRDLVRSWLGLSPHRIPVVGKPGDVALMTTPDALDAFEQFSPPYYVNEACARIAIRGDKYRPVKHAGDVRCPTLLQICEKDDLVPTNSVETTAKLLGDLAEVKRYPIGHFDIYMGEHFEASVADQNAFLHKHLTPS